MAVEQRVKHSFFFQERRFSGITIFWPWNEKRNEVYEE